MSIKSEKAKEYLNPADPEVAVIIAEKCFMPMKSEEARLHVLQTEPYWDTSGRKTITDIAFEAIVIAESDAEQKCREREQ